MLMSSHPRVEEGVAVFSRYPIIASDYLMLPWYRSFLLSKLTFVVMNDGSQELMCTLHVRRACNVIGTSRIQMTSTREFASMSPYSHHLERWGWCPVMHLVIHNCSISVFCWVALIHFLFHLNQIQVFNTHLSLDHEAQLRYQTNKMYGSKAVLLKFYPVSCTKIFCCRWVFFN